MYRLSNLDHLIIETSSAGVVLLWSQTWDTDIVMLCLFSDFDSHASSPELLFAKSSHASSKSMTIQQTHCQPLPKNHCGSIPLSFQAERKKQVQCSKSWPPRIFLCTIVLGAPPEWGCSGITLHREVVPVFCAGLSVNQAPNFSFSSVRWLK